MMFWALSFYGFARTASPPTYNTRREAKIAGANSAQQLHAQKLCRTKIVPALADPMAEVVVDSVP